MPVLFQLLGGLLGILEMAGFLWFFQPGASLLDDVYWLAPAFALLGTALIPSELWTNRIARVAMLAVALAGFVRTVHVLLQDVTQNDPDVRSACIRIAILALILILTRRAMRQR